jgi:hypothetical protein
MFFFATIAFEQAQVLLKRSKHGARVKIYWLDAVVDILAGNLSFNLVLWSIVLYGGWVAA